MREFRPPVRRSRVRTALAVVLAAVVLAVLSPLALIATASRGVSYTLSQGVLTIDSGSWLDGSRSLPLGLLHDKSMLTLRGGRRTLGTSLPGYSTGRFTYPDIGPVWQATNGSPEAVLLTTNDGDRPVVVTPPDREAFIAALDAKTPFRVALPPPDMTALRIGVLIGLAVAIPGAALVIATMIFGPARMVYRVGDGRLEIRTIFGRRGFPTHGMRARAHAAKLQLRLAGTAIPGYYTGHYVADGQRTRIYATLPSACVLIEGPTRVLVSPEDRAAFLEALHAEGATVG